MHTHLFLQRRLRITTGVLLVGLAFGGLGCAGTIESEDPAEDRSYLGGPATVCHVPPGDPNDAHTIEVGAKALEAHLAHGDSLGPCGGSPPIAFSTNSVAFDGVDDFVNVGNVYSFFSNQAYSMCLWFKTGSLGEAHLMGQQNPGSIRRGDFLHLDANGRVCFSRVSTEYGLKARECSATAPALGAWHHVCATTITGLESFSNTHLYVDGVEVTTLDTGQNMGTNSTANTGAFFTFGASASATMTTRPFQGHIDEVAMFLVDLTAGEVAAIYNSGSPGDLGALNPLPNSWWRMGECSDSSQTTVCDENLATGFDGVLVNGAAFSSDAP